MDSSFGNISLFGYSFFLASNLFLGLHVTQSFRERREKT
ncbi:MAG: hypothetical protein MRECE_1c123 [Mycoplasmataceae bacterium CE_OT135]|nr:MAG: hypothetical protein MRECE_1c044 [Mycoplasmataceae bacterium CE_OT135]KLL04355.1 MAG: hypothetical protein MRECE_1c123 [Mycoplasmataceae bacterium CE_OT135]